MAVTYKRYGAPAKSEGTQQETFSDNYGKGSKWQMGVAVDINNRKFEFGKSLSYNLTADQWSDITVDIDEREMGISHLTHDINSFPNNHIQYGDKALLGPSTSVDHQGYTESIRITTAYSALKDAEEDWASGVVLSLDKKNKYKYQTGDGFSIYCTGLAEGWYAVNAQAGTYGIRSGYSTMGNMSLYSTTDVDMTEVYEETYESTDLVVISIMLPIEKMYNGNWNTAALSGPGSYQEKAGGSAANYGPSVYHSQYGLDIWRDDYLGDKYGNIIQDNTWDWYGDNILEDVYDNTSDWEGVFRFVERTRNDEVIPQNGDYVSANICALFAYTTGDATNVTASNIGQYLSNTYTSIVTGFVHEGGRYSQHAQSLFSMVNSLSTTVAPWETSVSILEQPLIRSRGDSDDLSYSKVVGGTYYRLGFTHRSKAWPAYSSALDLANSEVKIWAEFQYGPIVANAADTADQDHYPHQLLSTNNVANSYTAADGKYHWGSEQSGEAWQTDMTYGFVDNPSRDLVDGSDSSLCIRIIQSVKNKSAQIDTQGRGLESMLYIDNIFLEHQGDIPGSSDKGYVEINHLPQSGTLRVNRIRNQAPVTLTLSDGTTSKVDPTGTAQRWQYQVDADFTYVKQAVWQQFLALQEWQDMGHRLTLHPFLPNCPDTLVGFMTISNVEKSFWDLERFSFHFQFTESD